MEARVRVLNVHAGNIFGGVETIMLSVVRQRSLCPEMVWDFRLCFEDRLARELQEAGARVEPLGEVRASRPWTVVQARRRLAAALRADRPDVAACHSAWAQAIFGPVIRRAGVPNLLWLHNQTTGRSWPERWSRLHRPDHVLCVSRTTAATLPRLYRDIPHGVIYAPLPPAARTYGAADREAVRRELGTAPEATVIIQVARMEAWKGQDLHLEALAELREIPGWELWLVGGAQRPEEEAYVASLKALAAGRDLAGRVRFLGKRSDVPRLLAGADLFCQPNRESEGFSIAFMEAFLAGLPIITTALGGAVEIVTEACGRLLPAGDAPALRAALRELLTEHARRAELGRAARRRVDELCDPAQQLAAYRDLMLRLAAGRPR
jgi:glycosyltransferase involved in cell wall biosynthesis